MVFSLFITRWDYRTQYLEFTLYSEINLGCFNQIKM